MKYPQFFLEKPDASKMNQKKAITHLAQLGQMSNVFPDFFDSVNMPNYLYWDKFQYKSWDHLKYKISFAALSKEELWFLVRQFRNVIAKNTFLKAKDEFFFRWVRLATTDEFLHKIDTYTGAKISPTAFSFNESRQLIIHGIMEEAIASSQLEGAHTTRAAAKKMLLEARQPTNESEQMILNNYRTIMAIEQEYKKSALSLDLIFELHHKLTAGTLPAKDQGRLRTDKDPVVVEGNIGTSTYISHIPPREKFLKAEMERLIVFANDEESKDFLHPIIKAIFLHFWIGYLHPFVDGNGRLARALFYWYLLKKGYWMMMYLPISTFIKKAPAQYAMAYIYTEQDNFDLTYFFDFHIKKILQSLEDFENYLARKTEENKKLERLFDGKIILNERQKKLLHYLLSDEAASTTMTSHAELYNISRQTAAKDLKELEETDLLISKREGKYTRYYPSAKLKELKRTL